MILKIYYKLFQDKVFDVLIGKKFKNLKNYKLFLELLFQFDNEAVLNNNKEFYSKRLSESLNYVAFLLEIKKIPNNLENDWSEIIMKAITLSLSIFDFSPILMMLKV